MNVKISQARVNCGRNDKPNFHVRTETTLARNRIQLSFADASIHHFMKYNLSEISQLIRDRRSITPDAFSDRKVHREQIEHILTNATWAPTHGMTQPWRFKVFMGDGLKKVQLAFPEFYRQSVTAESFKQSKYDRLQQRLTNISVLVAICMERDKTGKIIEKEEIEAVACGVQNMMLTSTAYGLGSFWSTPKFIYSHEMRSFLGLGEDDQCLGLFYIGYPSGDWPTSHRKPLEYVCEWIVE